MNRSGHEPGFAAGRKTNAREASHRHLQLECTPYEGYHRASIRGDVENTGNMDLAMRVMVPTERNIPEPARYSLLHNGRGKMLDHILVSRTLLAYFKGSEVHNELLHDESIVFASKVFYPESDHAPVIARFELPETRIKWALGDGASRKGYRCLRPAKGRET